MTDPTSPEHSTPARLQMLAVLAVTGSSLAMSYVMQAWATEACFDPMFALIKQIG